MVLFLSSAIAQAEVEVTGFVDVLGQAQQGEATTFGMGAYEVDFVWEYSPRLYFEGAVVVEGEEVGLGQTFVEFKPLKEKYRDILAIQAGFFDMPFGLDYEVYATPDRKLVTSPLVTEQMMDGGWGDIGINFCGSYWLVNYNLYGVNGFGEDNGDPVNQLADNNDGKTFGCRLGFSPMEDVEVGISYAGGPYLDDNTEDLLQRMGAHLKFSWEKIEGKGEYVFGKQDILGKDAQEENSYYVQLLGKLTDELYTAARFGGWKPKGESEISRITTTLGYDLSENISLRLEYQFNIETPRVKNDLFSLQTVVCF